MFEIDWTKAPKEATHYDYRWDKWMWLDAEFDWLSYLPGVRHTGWEISYPSNKLVKDYFIARPTK